MSDDGLLVFAAIALGLGVFLGYPMAAEDTAKPCLALERHVVGALSSFDDGAAAEQTAAKRMPGVPAFLGCTVLYWQATLDTSTTHG